MSDPWAEFRAPQQPADPWADFRVAPAEAPRSMGENIGLGARATMQGLAGSLPGMLYDAAAVPFNMAGRALGYGDVIPPLSSRATQAADALGLPVPRDEGERVRGAAISGAASALGGAGAGRVIAAAPGAVGMVGQALSAQPVVQAASGAIGGAVGEASDSPALGAAAALTAPLALNAGAGAVRRIVTPAGQIDPERARLAAIAAQEGIPLSSGQATGSRPQQWLESAFESMPLTGGTAARFNETQQAAFNRAVLSRAGIAADKATPEVLNRAQARFAREYTELAGRNTMRITPEFMQALQGVADLVAPMTDDATRAVRSWAGQIVAKSKGAELGGPEWQRIHSAIGRQIGTTQNSEVRTALQALRSALDDGMEASIKQYGNADDWTRWTDLRRQYSAFATVRDVMGRAGEKAALGDISPLALRGELAGSNTYAMGRGDMADLARVGQSLLRGTPSSGTAERTAAIQTMQGGGSAGMLAGGLALGSPAMMAASLAPILGPRAVQALYNNPTVQAYLRNQALASMPNPVGGQAMGAIAATQAGRLAEGQVPRR